MRIIFGFFLLLVPAIGLLAQEKKIYYDYNWKTTADAEKASFVSIVRKTDSGWQQQDFYTSSMQFQMTGLYADDSLKVKNGCFRWYYADGKLKEAGCYKNNRPQGLQLSYHPNGSLEDSILYNDGVLQNYGLSWHSNGIMYDSLVAMNDSSVMRYRWFDNGYPDCTGILVNDKEQGNWKYFHNNGQLAADVDYLTGEKIKARYYKEDGSPAAANANTETEVKFNKAKRGWTEYIEGRLRWPKGYMLSNNRTSGVAAVRFIVDAEGMVKDAYMSAPLHPEFDKIVLDMIYASPKWKQPGISNNRRVQTWHLQSVYFVLQ